MNSSYQYIAFSMITGNALAVASSSSEAILVVLEAYQTSYGAQGLPDAEFIEVLACKSSWPAITLSNARRVNRTTYRGAGYAPHLPPVDLAE
jgi:hypothetical protein